jgi:hypothetical protein
MGRAMESVDRARIVTAIYPVLLDRSVAGLNSDSTACAIAAGAEGYAFPTNLDRDPPLDGLTPPSQQDVVLRALEEGLSPAELAGRLADHAERRLTH